MKNKAPVSAQAIETEIFHAGGDLPALLETHLSKAQLEGNVLAITSKIVSLSENRIVARAALEKSDVIKREADHYLCPGTHGAHLTIKHGLLIPSAGIDESNSETGGYILYPEFPYASAQKIHADLKMKFNCASSEF